MIWNGLLDSNQCRPPNPVLRLASAPARWATIGLCRGLLSLRSKDLPPRGERPRIYAANHASHADFVAIWTALPQAMRMVTRPVAGADYWEKTPLRRWLITHVFNGVLIDRSGKRAAPSELTPAPAPQENPAIARLSATLQAGEDLIFFPEGTRNLTDVDLLRIRSGIYQILEQVPEAEVVPLWISHMSRILPKGAWLPVPLNCTLTFGTPLRVGPDESRAEFLDRLHAALLECKANAL